MSSDDVENIGQESLLKEFMSSKLPIIGSESKPKLPYNTIVIYTNGEKIMRATWDYRKGTLGSFSVFTVVEQFADGLKNENNLADRVVTAERYWGEYLAEHQFDLDIVVSNRVDERHCFYFYRGEKFLGQLRVYNLPKKPS